MPYDFLNHLTQAPLPVVIYDEQLIAKLIAYENQRFIVKIKHGLSNHSNVDCGGGVRVIKVTMAGRPTVHRHLKNLKSMSGVSK